MTQFLDTAVRTLLLPLRPGTGTAYAERAEHILNSLGVAEDLADWVLLESKAWETTGKPSGEFAGFVGRLLHSPELDPPSFAIDVSDIDPDAAPEEILGSFSAKYFDLHARIMSEEKVDHQQAKRVLSHTHTMILLATGGRMTASRIYSMLLTDGIALGKSWSTTRFILDSCGIKQDVSADDVKETFDADADAEPDLLGDLSLDGCLGYVAETCGQFGYDGPIVDQLQMLFGEERHLPYLCMLHFQLTTLALFNHRLTNGYEFSPRGEGVLWLTDRYNESGLNVGLSPFLNNAKSVDTLDAGWASAKKKKERNTARALVDLLAGLDRLSDPSRAAAGNYLRALLHRVIRTSKQKNEALNSPIPTFTEVGIGNLVSGVSNGNTGTRGVIEQRLVDCVALIEAGDLRQWRLRGFGDSVFTTNTSQKKLGDVELKHAMDPRIVALEAHGGRLTEKYVQDHLFTLSNVIPLRIAELEDREPLPNWSIELQFISHDLDNGMTTELVMHDIRVTISYRRFSDLVGIEANTASTEIFEEWFRAPLNIVHVHPEIRNAARDMMQP